MLACSGSRAGNSQTKDDQASDLRPKDKQNRMTTRAEVARAAGVSPYTVSVVLNDPAYGRVGAATRERVQRVAEELGYQPQAAGRALRLGRTELLAYVASAQLLHEVTSYHGALVPALLSAANEAGYDLAIVGDDRPEQLVARLRRATQAGRFDGVIVGRPQLQDPVIDLLRQSRVPFVLAGSHPDRLLPQVRRDDAGVARLVAERLLALGHRRVALLTAGDTPARYEYARRRRDVLREHAPGGGRQPAGPGPSRSPPRALPARTRGGRRGGGVEGALDRVRREGISAVVTENDCAGAEVMRAAQDAGWDVPGRLERGQPVRGAPAPALPAHAGERLRRPLRRRAGGGDAPGRPDRRGDPPGGGGDPGELVRERRVARPAGLRRPRHGGAGSAQAKRRTGRMTTRIDRPAEAESCRGRPGRGAPGSRRISRRCSAPPGVGGDGTGGDPAPGKVQGTLTYGLKGGTPAQLQAVDEAVARFRQQFPEVNVQADHFFGGDKNWLDVFLAKRAADSLPDTFGIIEYNQGIVWAYQGTVQALDPFIKNDKAFKLDEYQQGAGQRLPRRGQAVGGTPVPQPGDDLRQPHPAGAHRAAASHQRVEHRPVPGHGQAGHHRGGQRAGGLGLRLQPALVLDAGLAGGLRRGHDLPDRSRFTMDTPESLAALQFDVDLIYRHRTGPPPDAAVGPPWG